MFKIENISSNCSSLAVEKSCWLLTFSINEDSALPCLFCRSSLRDLGSSLLLKMATYLRFKLWKCLPPSCIDFLMLCLTRLLILGKSTLPEGTTEFSPELIEAEFNWEIIVPFGLLNDTGFAAVWLSWVESKSLFDIWEDR